MSAVALLINLGALGVYGYSAYFLNSAKITDGMRGLEPAQLNRYGQLKFLTYQCLLIQILNASLHILAHFIRPLARLRDLIFSTLAFPVGSVVVYSFWAVWFLLGRELILPEKMDAFLPAWLNHSIHTIIVPINILVSVLVRHRYSKRGLLLTLVYLAFYVTLLHVIKAQSGLFVYGFLETFDTTQRIIYFAGTGFFTYLMYKSGQWLTSAVHGEHVEERQPAGGKQKKQKQK